MLNDWLSLCHCVAHDNNHEIDRNEVPNNGYILGSLNDHDKLDTNQC
jgi:hypothetical protein